MSEISFFEVFAGTDIRSPSVFRGFLGSVPLSAVAGSRAVQASAVFSFSAASIRGGCSLPFLFPSCPSFSCACSFLKSPSQFPREALGSVVLLRAIETPVLGRYRCFPVQMRSVPRGSEEKRRQAGENRKKTEKVEKKSLKSLEIRQRALPLQSRSGRGPRCLLRGSGEVH